jgi:Raf kinase inhibitor-like YbhB/YbcL family protein
VHDPPRAVGQAATGDTEMLMSSAADRTATFARIALASGALATMPCAAPPALAQEGKSMMTITSSAFVPKGAIPAHYTCEGRDVSPPLAWHGVPAGTKSLALVVDDPDAPDPASPKMIWVHWVVYDIPPSASGLAEAVKPGALPPGTREGANDFGRTAYGGPCPPIGRHRYFFKLYALDLSLPGLGRASKAALEKAMRGHVLAEATLMGTYQKQR